MARPDDLQQLAQRFLPAPRREVLLQCGLQDVAGAQQFSGTTKARVVRARSTSLRSPGLGSTISLAKAAGRFHIAPPDPLLAKQRQASVVDTAKGTANSQADEIFGSYGDASIRAR